jgi:hypothetical protein
MAAPTYATDLATGLIHACDAASASWTEPTGFTVGAITVPETDFFIHNTGCLSKNQQTTGGNGAIYNMASGQTIPANGAVLAWIIFSAPNALATQAAGGMQMFVGSATSAFKHFYVKGSDTYPYGGWQNIAVNPLIDSQNQTISVNSTNRTYTRSAGDFTTDGFEPGMTVVMSGFTNAGNNGAKIIESVTTTVITVTSGTGLVTETGGGDERVRFCDAVTGAPSTTMQYFGAGVNCPTFAPTKGQAFGLDVLRYGRCESRFYNGDSGTPATFAGFATQNDDIANRWGLIQYVNGAYLFKGLMVLGYSAAVYFSDANVAVNIDDTQKVTSAFNGIEIRNASSTVIMTAISFTKLGTVSRGNWITTDNATVTLTNCTFTDMGTFGFQSNTTASGCVFRRCQLVTRNNATLTNCTFDRTTDTVKALLLRDPSNGLTGANFISSGTKHAIEITETGSYTFTNCSFSGYASSNGSTGNETIYNNSGGSVTINHSGTSGNLTYKNEGSSTTTLVGNTRKLTITNIVSGSEVRIYSHNTTTELSGNDDVTVGYHEYSYQFVSNTYVDIVVHHKEYIYYRIDNYLLTDSDSSLPVAQQYDRQYKNP